MTDDHDYGHDEERELLTAEEERTAELALDVRDEERDAEEQKAAAAADPDDDGDECHAELIDGAYTFCGCAECWDRQAQDTQDAEHAADYSW